MPTQDALIRAVDYNNVHGLQPNSVARILNDRIADFASDPIRATYGYGQALLSSGRDIGDIVDAADLVALKLDILKVARHCGIETHPLITALPSNIVPGLIIDNDHLTAFENVLSLLVNNRFNLAAGQYSDELLKNPSGQPISHSRSTAWGGASIYAPSSNIRHQFTVEFGSSQNARYFFNSGGQIRFSASRTGGTNSYQNLTWSNALNAMGTIIFDYTSTTATGPTQGEPKGFYDLSNTPTRLFTTSPTAVYVYTDTYAMNDYTIEAHCDDITGSNQFGDASRIIFNIYFNDDYANPGRPINDSVDGLITSNVSIRRASGSNVEIPAPIANNTRLLST